jgi:hypothetical protein
VERNALRSARWFGANDLAGFIHRASLHAEYLEHVLQADQGCDFDFLRAIPGKPAESEPLGLLNGWVGGW